MDALRILCLTWNVNGQPCTEPMDGLLCRQEGTVDVYAIGFQEMEEQRLDEWISGCNRVLGANYSLLKKIYRNTTTLLLLVRNEIIARVTNAEDGHVDYQRKSVISNRVVGISSPN